MDLKDVIYNLNTFAPLKLSESWDNVGLLVEPPTVSVVSKILLTNDLTLSVMDEAEKNNVDLILSYHPPLFHPLKKITSQNWKEKIIGLCMVKGIAIYSPHTCYDALKGGVNDWLIEAFGKGSVQPISYSNERWSWSHLIKLVFKKDFAGEAEFEKVLKSQYRDKIRILSHDDKDMEITCQQQIFHALIKNIFSDRYAHHIDYHTVIKLEEVPILGTGMGRLTQLQKPLTVEEAVSRVKKHLSLPYVRLALKHGGTLNDKVHSVAVCAGSGSSVLKSAKADLYLTGELSHHEVLDFTQRGASVILTDHSNSERGYLSAVLKGALNNLFGGTVDIIISKMDSDPLKVV